VLTPLAENPARDVARFAAPGSLRRAVAEIEVAEHDQILAR